jgi:hypothetical protein
LVDRLCDHVLVRHARSRYRSIVKDGKSDWVIYSPSTATPTESLAARELARYLKQMSGVDLRSRTLSR